MPTCIIGMHRSGTSLVTSMLQDLGLFLGDEDKLLQPNNEKFKSTQVDNPRGYFENMDFIQFNDEILALLGGDFLQVPSIKQGWSADKKFIPLRNRITGLASQFEGHTHWGWKDPRTTLTLELWQAAFTDLKLIICIRNPLEVARSLVNRNVETQEQAFDLIRQYYDALSLTYQNSPYLITHYDVYFYDPMAELQRIADYLALPATTKDYDRAMLRISEDLHRKKVSSTLLEVAGDLAVNQHYQSFCAQAGHVFEQMQADDAYQRNQLAQYIQHQYTEVQQHHTKNQEKYTQLETKFNDTFADNKRLKEKEKTLKQQVDDMQVKLIEETNRIQVEEQVAFQKQLETETKKLQTKQDQYIDYLIRRGNKSLQAIHAKLEVTTDALYEAQMEKEQQTQQILDLSTKLAAAEDELRELLQVNRVLQRNQKDTLELNMQLKLAQLTARLADQNSQPKGNPTQKQPDVPAPQEIANSKMAQRLRATYHSLVPVSARLYLRDVRRKLRSLLRV